jgi:hypothetical protein
VVNGTKKGGGKESSRNTSKDALKLNITGKAAHNKENINIVQ